MAPKKQSKVLPVDLAEKITPHEYTYTSLYPGGVKITVRINFHTKLINIVDVADPSRPKHFVFAGRGLEYMKGWLQITKALYSAIAAAEDELRAYVEREEAGKKEMRDRIVDALFPAGEEK